MSRLAVLLCATFAISVSSITTVDNEDENISQSYLTIRYENILSNLSKSDDDALSSAFKEMSRVKLVVNVTLHKENETLFTDLRNFEDNNVVEEIKDKGPECLQLSESYEETKRNYFLEYSTCLKKINETLMNKTATLYGEYRSFWFNLVNTNVEYACTDFEEVENSSKLNDCLTKLKATVDKIEEEYFSTIEGKITSLSNKIYSLSSSELSACNNIYNSNKFQLQTKLTDCIQSNIFYV
ncbi:uncharacterized protein LOC122504022 [Leptopilina heterotoma]|uniref:uncharacterized protein LOC122504022 n=1 Tax=Leptopilina heterotoma TaxID=63436 RepID=UPI001CA7ED38|nr:uncharacterized protein LOC122504022 [Leptopilina heterotoma]